MWHFLSLSILFNIQFIRWKAMNFPFSRVDSHVNDRWTIFKLILIWILLAVIALYGVNSFLPLNISTFYIQCCYNANLDDLLSFYFIGRLFSRLSFAFFVNYFKFYNSTDRIRNACLSHQLCVRNISWNLFLKLKLNEGNERKKRGL